MNILLATDTGGGYAAAAYLVFLLMLAIYLAIMSNKLTKMQRTLGEIRRRAEQPKIEPSKSDPE
jgi:hypothetical protein